MSESVDASRSGRPGPLVSVVVPAFNAAAYLGAALDSLRAQTVRELEIIVVDDGSSDDTAAIAHRHASEDPRVRVISLEKPSGRPASARNAGRLTTDVRVLLDANLPRTFAALLPGHRVDTVHQRHWSDLNDRSLLDSAEREYDAFLRRPRIDLPRVPRLA